MKWKTLFMPHILDRGYDYFLDDRVEIINETDGIIEANVYGSDAYNVSINMGNDSVMLMDCDCPYAADGNYCKHMAAVLYQYYENEEQEEIETDDIESYEERSHRVQTESQKEIVDLLSKIPENEKQHLLVDLLRRNTELRNSLKLQYDFQMDAKQLSALKQEIQNIVRAYTVNGFVEWGDAFSFCCDLDRFLEEKVKVLIAKGALPQAFQLSNQIFNIIGMVDMDDSDGGSVMVAEKCYAIWEEIILEANEDEKSEFRKWFYAYKEGTLFDWIEEYLIAFREDVMATSKEIREAMEELDQKIEGCGDSNDCGFIYTVSGSISLIEKRIDYMRRLGSTQNEIDHYCQQHRQFYVVRHMEINKAIDNGDLEGAIAIILESRQLDQNNKSLLDNYCQHLIKLYRESGKRAEYLSELKSYLLNYSQKDVKYFCELKEQIGQTEEWPAIVEQVLERNKRSQVVYDFLLEEDSFSRMMDMIEESGSVFVLDRYFKYLSKKVPDRVIAFYSNCVNAEMTRVSSRKNYRYTIRYLKKMEFCAAGKAQAKAIADTWKIAYRRRPALLDELKKAGY